MIEAEFSIDGMNAWINDISSKYLTRVRIIDCIPWRGKGGQAIFEVEEPFDRTTEMIEDIRQHPDISGIQIDETISGRIRGVVEMRTCAIIRIIMSAGCFLESATAQGDGKVTFSMVAGNNQSLPTLFKELESMGLIAALESLTRVDDQDSLTRKQEEVIRLALDMGYFENPRKVKLTDLAKICGIATSTLTDILRRGERNVLREHFKDKG
jgi:predicted DNA binding protein